MKQYSIAAAALLALAGCGDEPPREQPGEVLEEAAEYSTPAAADVLENRAEALEGRELEKPISAPGSPVQEALQDAGNAAAEALPANQAQPQ